MSAPLGSIRTWSDAQLVEDTNDKDGISTAKYNERWRRVKAHKEEAERRAREEAEWMAQEKVEWGAWEEQWRVEAEKHKVKEQVKKHVSHFCFVITELMVLGGGDHCATVQKGQGEGVGAAGVQPVHGAWARVRTRAR